MLAPKWALHNKKSSNDGHNVSSTLGYIVNLVNRNNYCVTSCATKDLRCYFVWVMNFKLVWKNHIKTQLNQSNSIQRRPTLIRLTRHAIDFEQEHCWVCFSETAVLRAGFLWTHHKYSWSTDAQPHSFHDQWLKLQKCVYAIRQVFICRYSYFTLGVNYVDTNYECTSTSNDLADRSCDFNRPKTCPLEGGGCVKPNDSKRRNNQNTFLRKG